MNWLSYTILENFAGILVLIGIYYYLYRQYKEKYLGIWTLSWFIYSIRLPFEFVMATGYRTIPALIANQVLSLSSGMFLLWGTYAFIGRPFPKKWIYFYCLTSMWIVIAITFGFSFDLLALPTFTFLGCISIWTGIKFLQLKNVEPISKNLTGYAFIVWGLHKADYPFLRQVDWFAPYGYIVSSILILLSAFGIFLLYFQKINSSLEKKNQYFTMLVEQAADAIFIVNAKGKILDINQQACNSLGYSRNELLKMTVADFETTATLEQLIPEWEHLSPQSPITRYGMHKRKDGTTFPVEVRLGVLDTRGDKLILGLARDITERKQSEETLTKLSRQNELILESANEGICELDANGLITFINTAGARLCGYDPDVLIGKSLHSVVHYAKHDGSPYPEEECPVYDVCMTGTPTFILDDVFWKKDGSSFYVTASCSPVIEDNAIVGVVVTFRDVTEHLTTLKALEESEKKYRTIFEQSKDAIVVTTPEGILLDINPAGLQLFGYNSREEALKLDIASNVYVSPYGRTAFRTALERQGYVSDYELRLKTKRGEVLTVLVTSNLSKNDAGVINFQTIIRDVSEQRKLQQQLLQAQKMEAVGQLAGGIAHDFNNILSAITGYGYLIQTKLPREDPMRADVEQILESANRAAEVTHSLLAFSRKQIMNPVPVDMNELIKKMVKLLSRLIGEDVEVITTLTDEDVICRVDASQIEQILINLATNARDAMPEGGRLSLKTEIVHIDENFIASHGFGKSGAYVSISVSDTGTGMDHDATSKIFEPFFTTKEVGKGTGLGLAMVYGIIKQHEGYIVVNSELGRGSTFQIYLAAMKMEEDAIEVTSETGIPYGTETILVAEDDDKLRKLYEVVLTQHGYKVMSARDGEEAIVQFIKNKDNIGLVMLDMIMPKKSGKETYDAIKEIRPEARFLFLSGYTADRLDTGTLTSEDVSIISKPVSPKDLLHKLREILDN